MGRESRLKDDAYRRGALASLAEMEQAIVATYGAAVWEASQFYVLMQKTREKYSK